MTQSKDFREDHKGEVAIILSGLAMLVSQAFAQLHDDLQRKFDQADQKIVRLPPSAFPELPENIVRELQRRDCNDGKWLKLTGAD